MRSQVIPPTILPHLCKSLLLLWNSFFADSMGKHVAEVLCKSSENPCLPLRLVHVLSALAQQGANGEDAGLRQLLSDTIVAAGYFASLSPYTQMLCVLGWQRSLLLHLCRLPFDYLQDAKNRRIIMPTLVVMLYRSPPALDAIKGDLSCSWMASFLEDTTSMDRDTRNRMEVMLSANHWADALEFFKNAV
ncbi:S phase cyclin A-associated protein in the endoplasmic reticulum [Aphelenchoides avenae]|nr:S phase cyclin A-associated protein in the endoplasmic reticulum [Aphelenchus avenae]